MEHLLNSQVIIPATFRFLARNGQNTVIRLQDTALDYGIFILKMVEEILKVGQDIMVRL